MARRARRGGHQQPVNIETHSFVEMVIPQLRIAQWEIAFLHHNMPAPGMLESRYGWLHILHLCIYASQLCEYSLFDMESVRWAILTHDCGHYHDDIIEDQHVVMSAYVAARMIEKVNNPDIDTGKIISLVGRHSDTDEAISKEEAVLRAADRLDCWRLPNFPGIDATLMEAPGWRKVEKIAKQLRLEGRMRDG